MNILIEIIGWYGFLAIITAYGGVSFSLLGVKDTLYQILNLTGAAGIVVVSLRKRAYPPAVLNIVWLIIALIALIKMIWMS